MLNTLIFLIDEQNLPMAGIEIGQSPPQLPDLHDLPELPGRQT